MVFLVLKKMYFKEIVSQDDQEVYKYYYYNIMIFYDIG